MSRRRQAPRKAAELTPKPDNPRTISKAALEALGTTMRRYGDLSGVVFNRRTGHVVGGHQRLKQIPADATITIVHRTRKADEQGTVAVGFLETSEGRWAYREIDVDRATENAMNLRANNVAGAWQDEQLAALVRGLRKSGAHDLTVLGFPPGYLDKLLAAQAADEAPEPDTPKVPKRARSRVGTVYELGPHRMLCGSATQPDLVAKLMGEDRAHLIYTDPPYGVSLASDKHEAIAGDEKRRDQLLELLVSLFRPARAVSQEDAAWYVWHASATRAEFTAALQAVGLLELQYLTWVKEAATLGWAHYQWSSEPCFYAGDPEHPPRWFGGRDEQTVWRCTARTARGVSTTIGGGILLLDGSGRSLYVQAKPPKGRKIRTQRLQPGEALELSAPDEAADVWEITRDRKPEHPSQKPVALALRALRNSSQEGEIVYDPCAGAGGTVLAAELAGRRARVAELKPAYCDVIRQRYADLVRDPQWSPTRELTP